VDTGGGHGTTAMAIARAFPHVRCSVLELPHVVDAAAADGSCTVEFVAGDMLEFIPSADVVLLKVCV
jgi:trans-aconitate methyltransferase